MDLKGSFRHILPTSVDIPIDVLEYKKGSLEQVSCQLVLLATVDMRFLALFAALAIAAASAQDCMTSDGERCMSKAEVCANPQFKSF